MADRGGFEPIAVLGVGCRLPGGANDPESFWKLLEEGRDAVGPVPRDRWDLDGLYHPDFAAPGRIHQREGGFVDHIADFDAGFFGMSPKEAGRVDPQQRLILEAAHQALENAGLPPGKLSGSRTGVFVGISSHDFSDIQSAPPEWSLIGPHTNQGGAQSIAANRVSYTWNLLGPSLAVDTACSSTIYALHYALASLRGGDCEVALVGGVNALLTPGPTIGFSKGSFLSARGRCQAFSAHADGFVRAEGSAVLVLKSLSNALADRDPILAVIRQTAVNEDGHTDGMALPSESAQVLLLKDAYARAGVDPAGIGYVEAHGTGTPAGDPIEARAIGTVLGRGRPADRPLYVGSVKTNIGHLEAGAGAASLLKTILAIGHRWIPPSLHATDLNPEIPFESLRMEVVRQGRAWPAWDEARRAGVNAFGFGGANAHAVLEAAPARPAARPSVPGPVLATLSARTPEALAALARQHLDNGVSDLADIAWTTVHHRDHHGHRAAIVARDHDEWHERLRRLADGQEDPGIVTGKVRGEPGPIAFVCSGQGPQWWAMGRQLLATDPIVRGTIEGIDALFHGISGWSVLEALSRDEASSRIDETQVAQPALFALQMALARRWESLGIVPKAVVGHSVGEVAAGVLSGALTLDQGVAIIYHRSRIQQKAHGAGRMLAVGQSWEQVAPLVAPYADRVSPAAFNRPNLVVLSGDAGPLEAIAAKLAKDEVFHRFVAVQVPFHSHHMTPLKAELDKALGRVAGVTATKCALYSTVAGDRIGGPEMAGDYWYRNVREPVRFVQAVRALLRDGMRTFVELSPHPILMPGLEDLIAEAHVQGLAVPSMRRDTDEEAFLLQAAGRLYAAGHSVGAARAGHLVHVPHTPWERKRHWFETASGRADRLGGSTHPAIRRHRPSASDPTRHSFQLSFDPRVDQWLKDHVVQGMIVVPGAALLEAALACGRAAWGDRVFLADVTIERALFAPSEDEASPPEVWLEVDGDDGRFRIVSREEGATEWVRHVSGRIDHRGGAGKTVDPDLQGAARCRPIATPDKFYPAMAERGLSFGPAFRTLADLSGHAEGGRAESIARIAQPPIGASRHLLHPAVLDACFQALLGAALAAPGGGWRVYLPVGMASVRIGGPARGGLRARTIVRQIDERWLHGDVWLVDESGAVVAEVLGFEGKALVGAAGAKAEQYEIHWLPEERPDQWAGRVTRLPIDGVEAALEGAEPDAAWGEFEKGLAELALAYAAEALRALVDLDQPVTLPLPVTGHERFCRRLLDALTEAGWLVAEGGAWRLGAMPAYDIAAMEQALAAHPRRTAEYDAVRVPGRALADVLRGQTAVTEVLFGPDAALATLYADGYQFAGPERLLARALKSVVAGAPADRLLRVLEVGAGTGGLTTHLLPVLPDDRVEYVYTDVSAAFSEGARERFAGWPFVRYAELDLERPPTAQGYGPGTFDVVAASDVLHATTDLRASLRRVADLLAPGGVLLLLELTDPPFYADVMFGLAEGWWAFRDTDLRHHATVPVGAWQALLAEAGFDVVSVGRFAGDQTRQSVFVARKSPQAAPSVPERPRTDGTVVIVGEGGPVEPIKEALRARGVPIASATPDKVAPIVLAEEAAAVLFVAVEPKGVPDDLGKLHLRTTEPLRKTALGIARSGRTAPLFVVTKGAVAALPGEDVSVGQGPLWGLGRVLASELPQVPFRLVDLGSADAAEVDSLVSEVLTDAADRDVALRGTRRLVGRIDRAARTAPARPARDGEGWRLRVGEPGVLDTLRLEGFERAGPGPSEVEVEIRAAGLNFKDLMRAMGLLPRSISAGHFGLEGSGVVARVGREVSDLKPGDEVVVVGSGTFGSYVTTHRSLVARKPAHLSHEEAATLPIAMGTAWYGLDWLARLAPGERVLVHSATGGVGHAAVQVALRRGCEVHATAGSERKRAYLREKLGLVHVYDSRSLDFAHQIREATGGQGVDVVLNSLAGAAIPRSLECLAPYGRFVEIGITDLYDNARLGLGAFKRNLTYAAVDLEHLIKARPEEFGRRVLAPMLAAVARRELDPLPLESAPMADVGDLFARMSRSTHIGKLVAVRDPAATVAIRPATKELSLRSDRTWVVTGGTRGFGHRIAQWLVEQGVRHVALLSATGRLDVPNAEAVAGWRAAGVTVRVSAVDVGHRAALDAELKAIRAGMAPIGGVVHAAMVLDDGPIDQLGPERFAKVMGPKAGGALHLHALTGADPIEYFVLLSSVSELGGNPGQGNYNAANALLASLAWHRRHTGRPATVVNLGVVADVGFVAGHQQVQRTLDANGLVGNASEHLVTLLAGALRDGATQRAIGTVDWQTAGRLFAGVGAFARRVHRAAAKAGASDLRSDLAALDLPARTERVVPLLRKQIARVVAAEVDAVPLDEPITDLGLDSLMVNQIASWLQAELGVNVPTMRLLKGPTIEQLAADIAGRIAEKPKEAAAAPPPREELPTIHRAIWADHAALPGSASGTFCYGLEGPVDADALERAVRALVARHDLLHGHFEGRDGQVAYRASTVALPLARVDASGWADGDVRAAIGRDARLPFDLATELPIRATLYRRDEVRHVLDLRLHHVAFDAVTPFVLSEELLVLYDAEVTGRSAVLAPAPSVASLVAHEKTVSGDRASSRAWWKQRLAGSDLRLPLPRAERHGADDALMRPAVVPLDPAMGDGIRALAAEARTTPFAVLLTGWFLALHEELGADDLVVGTSVSLRDRPELQRFVGPAIQFVAIRARLDGHPTFRQALAKVADEVAGALEHRGVPLYDLVEELIPPERINGRARFGLDANFHLYDAEMLGRDAVADHIRRREAALAGGVRFTEHAVPELPVVRPYDLTCGVWHAGGRYTAGVRYNPRVLDTDQAQRIGAGFASHLAMAAAGYRRRG